MSETTESKPLKKRSEIVRQKAVKDISSKLNEELRPKFGKEREDEDQKRTGYNYRTAQRAGKEKTLRDDLEQIVTTTFVEDMHKEWKGLRAGLSIGVDRSDHGTLQKGLDLAEARAHKAHRLYITAKLEMERWEAENEVIFGAMWNEAKRALQHDKETGLSSKQITDKDVAMKCAVLYPDEYREQEQKRRRVKLTVDSLSNLAECWMSRCRSLQAMLAKLRG